MIRPTSVLLAGLLFAGPASSAPVASATVSSAIAPAPIAVVAPAPATASVSAAPVALADRTARDVIADAMERVTAILHDEALSSEAKRAQVEPIVDEELDMPTLSALVLARNRTKFDDAQLERFASEFKTHLINTYWRNAESHPVTEIVIASDREESRGDWTVKTRILADGHPDVLIDYRMRFNDDADDWKIIDIIVEGASLISNFRSQFQEVVSDGGPDKLIDVLRDKNAEAAAKRKADSAEG